MKITNTTDFDKRFLRRLVSFCCKTLGSKTSAIVTAHFGNYGKRFSGRAWLRLGEIEVRIHKANDRHKYPFTHSYPKRKHAPQYTLNDRLETLVIVTAHEVAHIAQYNDGGSQLEARIDNMALEVLEVFRANREALFAKWSKQPERVAATTSETPKRKRRRRPKRGTLHQLKKLAQRMQATIEFDGWDLRATANAGRCWQSGLHELVESGDWSANHTDQNLAMAARMRQYGKTIPCDVVNCDWCESAGIDTTDHGQN